MERPWIVLKFGGTSVATAERWHEIASIVEQHQRSYRVWVVVSAVSGVTNLLERAIEDAIRMDANEDATQEVRRRYEQLARELGVSPACIAARLGELSGWLSGIRLTREASTRLRARILATGELLSSELGAAYFAGLGRNVRWVDARDLLVVDKLPALRGDSRTLDASMTPVRDPERAEAQAQGADVVITQGFIARTEAGETALLGRGGSDTSAALFAALLGAQKLEIWSDVPGLFTADPRLLPAARLLKRIDPREAQELAASGARALHPRAIDPVAWAGIPLGLKSTLDPSLPGTIIERTGEDHPVVHGVTYRAGVTLLSISTVSMFERAGFLADVFSPFAELDASVDLVGTSQSAVSVTLDRIPGGVQGAAFHALFDRLSRLGEVRVVHPCAVVSIVGRRIRAVLHDLGPALEVLQDRSVHLVSDSAEDLNLSFVVDEVDGPFLVARLHERLFPAQGEEGRLGPTWEQMARRSPMEPTRGSIPSATASDPWWKHERADLLARMHDGRPRFVYHLPSVRDAARELTQHLRAVDRLFFSMKANAHPAILREIREAGFGFECVSAAEVALARRVSGDSAPILFTPSFCPLQEYIDAFQANAEVTVDNEQTLAASPAIFRGREIGLRIDPGHGAGHHRHVKTAGAGSKFGLALSELDSFREAAARADARIVGLHAHVGSGVFDPSTWAATANTLLDVAALFPEIRWIDLGGGIGVPDRPNQPRFDLERLDTLLQEFRARLRGAALRLEPGRYLVSEAGVLLAPVTQVRRKGGVNLAGLATGMNSLIRPALYGAWHGIYNLTRLDEEPTDYWDIVGPICESADVLGRDRWLPSLRSGDIVLIANAGAYGRVMSSSYNQREPAEEVVLGG